MISDGSALPITHTGSTTIPTSSCIFTLQNVFLCPFHAKEPISIYQFCTNNHVSIEFSPSAFQVKDLNTGEILLIGEPKDDVYEWLTTFPYVTSSSLLTFSNVKTTSSEWHFRLGHPSFTIMKNIVSKFLYHCLVCYPLPHIVMPVHVKKSHKIPFSSSTLTSSHPLELLFSDVWTSSVSSVDGFQYYVIFVDHYTRYILYYPLK